MSWTIRPALAGRLVPPKPKGQLKGQYMDILFKDDVNKNTANPHNTAPNEFLNLQINPLPVRNDMEPDLLNYLQSLLERTYPKLSVVFTQDPCWIWWGALDRDGYPRKTHPSHIKGSALVYRFLWCSLYGNPGENLQVDHACGVRSCINPNHLRLLPPRLNREYGDHRKLNC